LNGREAIGDRKMKTSNTKTSNVVDSKVIAGESVMIKQSELTAVNKQIAGMEKTGFTMVTKFKDIGVALNDMVATYENEHGSTKGLIKYFGKTKEDGVVRMSYTMIGKARLLASEWNRIKDGKPTSINDATKAIADDKREKGDGDKRSDNKSKKTPNEVLEAQLNNARKALKAVIDSGDALSEEVKQSYKALHVLMTTAVADATKKAA
jgi:hypothetical protein